MKINAKLNDNEAVSRSAENPNVGHRWYLKRNETNANIASVLPSLQATMQAIVCARSKKNPTSKTPNSLDEVLELFPKDLKYTFNQGLFLCFGGWKMTLKFLTQNPQLKIPCIQIAFYLIKLDCQLNQACPKPYCSKTKSIHYFNLVHSVSVFKESLTTMFIWYISSLNNTV